METNKKIEKIIKIAEDKKAFEIALIDMEGVSTITDYFIIMSGNTDRHVRSIVDAIEEGMAEERMYVLGSKDGYREGRWIVLDYDDIIIHVFKNDEREYYKLEKLWSDTKITYLD